MTRQEAIDKVYGMSGTKEQHEALDFLVPEICELREFYDRQQENERVRKIITDSVFYQYGAGIEYKDVLDYLDKLEKQKEQKPAEWSDEDEKYLNRVINLWVNDFGEDSDTVKWLKSLRPSWKPSDEQMEALKWLVEYISPSEKYILIIKNLYEQLKKL